MAFNFTQTGAELQKAIDVALQVAQTYSISNTYPAGSYCEYNGVLYCAVRQTSGSFKSADWTAVTIAEDLAKATAQLAEINKAIPFSVTPTGGGRAFVETGGKNIICISCTQANVVGVPYGKTSSGWWCQFMSCASGTAITAVTTAVSGTAYVI